MNDSDTLALLMQQTSIRTDLQMAVQNPSALLSPDAEDFWNSCKKLHSCYNEGELDTQAELRRCKEIPGELYQA